MLVSPTVEGEKSGRLMSEICASVTKGSYLTFLDARLHGHDVIPAQAGIQGFAQILDMSQAVTQGRTVGSRRQVWEVCCAMPRPWLEAERSAFLTGEVYRVYRGGKRCL
jgi:hypothetical protein